MHLKPSLFMMAGLGLLISVGVPVATFSQAQSIETKSYPPVARAQIGTFQEKASVLSRPIIDLAYRKIEPEKVKVLGDSTSGLDSFKLSPEQIFDLGNPPLVRIFNHLTGTITIPLFSVDLKSLNIVKGNTSYTQNVDMLATGTGFFVNSDGYLLTNAHVASINSVLEDFGEESIYYYGSLLIDSILNLNEADAEELRNNLQNKYGTDPDVAEEKLTEDLSDQIIDYLDANAIVDVKAKLSIFDRSIKNPSVKEKSDLLEILDRSYQATLIDIDEEYKDNHNDVALLKIDQTNTPALSLNSEKTINVGQNVYVLGFPANASTDSSDFINSTLTSGNIGAIKNLDGATVYQTDAKISQGSSGGPALNSEGQVIGILTFLTDGPVGDSFAFAIPIQSGLNMLDKNSVKNDGSKFSQAFIEGLYQSDQKLCRRANEKFSIATQSNESFVDRSQLQKYTENCDKLIASGGSLDSNKDIVMNWLKNVPIYAWAGGVATVAIILSLVYFLYRYGKRSKMDNLSGNIPTSAEA